MQYDEFGSLTVRAYTGGEALPVPKTVVRIKGVDEENRFVEYSLITDVDGVTKEISLPSPGKRYSLSPNSAEVPYALYKIELSADGYYPKIINDVAIFSGVNAQQPIAMIPLPVRDIDTVYPRGNLTATVRENENLQS